MNSSRLKETTEYNCIPGPEGLAGTLKFVASWSEVWVAWESHCLRLGFDEKCLVGDYALNLWSLCQLQNCTVLELHRKACQSFRCAQGETTLTTTGDRKSTRSLSSHTNPGSDPSPEIYFEYDKRPEPRSPSCYPHPCHVKLQNGSFIQAISNDLDILTLQSVVRSPVRPQTPHLGELLFSGWNEESSSNRGGLRVG